MSQTVIIMKFTKENAVEKLNQILTNGGKKPLRMSDRTLAGQTEILMSLIANEEMELDEFVEKVKGSLESVNSNIEHDTAEAIRNYKEANPAPTTPAAPPVPPTGNEALMKRLEELEKKELERDTAAKMSAKKAEIKKYLADNNVKNDSWVEKALAMTSVNVEEDAEVQGKALLEFYNSGLADQKPTPPAAPKPGDGSEGFDAFSEVRNLRKQRAELA